MANLVQVKDLSMKINGRFIFENINFEINEGEIVGLLGHNGAGKTTMLKQIGNIEIPYDGEVLYKDEVLNTNIKNKKMAYIPDHIFLVSTLTIDEQINLFKEHYPLNEEFLETYLENLKLNKESKIKDLSKGNQEIFQLILMFATDADFYILDEPFTAIDIFRRDLILNMIIDLNCQGKTFIITTHLISDIEKLLTRVIYLNEGSIELDEEVDEIYMENNTLVDFLKEKYQAGGELL